MYVMSCMYVMYVCHVSRATYFFLHTLRMNVYTLQKLNCYAHPPTSLHFRQPQHHHILHLQRCIQPTCKLPHLLLFPHIPHTHHCTRRPPLNHAPLHSHYSALRTVSPRIVQHHAHIAIEEWPRPDLLSVCSHPDAITGSGTAILVDGNDFFVRNDPPLVLRQVPQIGRNQQWCTPQAPTKKNIHR